MYVMANKALHLTAIPQLRCALSAGDLGRSAAIPKSFHSTGSKIS